MLRAHRPKDDGIIDEVAIARTFLGDAKVGARLTTAEHDEVLRRAAARFAEEVKIREGQHYVLRPGYTASIGPEVLDYGWKSLLSEGLGLRERLDGTKRFDSLFRAMHRQRLRDAAA